MKGIVMREKKIGAMILAVALALQISAPASALAAESSASESVVVESEEMEITEDEGVVAETVMTETRESETDFVSENSLEGFVERLYRLILGREPDPAGFADWIDQLRTGQSTGASVVKGFIFSEEFKGKLLSNEDYVDLLYRVCLNREADAVGRSSWLSDLADGFSNSYILRGFIESAEFARLCVGYGIESGSITLSENRDRDPNITRFVARCYWEILGRAPDVDGLNDWTGKILKNKFYGQSVPERFIFSEEVNNRNLSDEAFVTLLYHGVLERDPEEAGLSDWMSRLSGGETRKKVYQEFIYSEEYKALLAKYGLPFTGNTSIEGLEGLKARVQQSLSGASGNWSVYVKNLDTNEYFVINNQAMYSASTIKLFVMEAVYQQIEDGKMAQTADVDKLLHDMITVSDNESMNELVRRLGGSRNNQLGASVFHEYIASQGYTSTHLGATLQPSFTPLTYYGGRTVTSAMDCGRLLEKIYRGENVSTAASSQMLDLLLGQTFQYKIPAGLPEGTIVGNKTGENDKAQNDTAIVYSPNCNYVICVFSSIGTSTYANVIKIREISSIVYQYFN